MPAGVFFCTILVEVIKMYPYNYQNILPAQQVLQVNGKASVDSIQMAPNSSVLVMDTTAPIVWLCVSDGVGRVTATPYDVSKHIDPPAPDSVEARLAGIEEAIKRMEERFNAKPDDADARHVEGSTSEADA